MPLPLNAVSFLALEISSAIENHIKVNTAALVANPDAKQDDGTKLLADAIAYGVAKGLGSAIFTAALTAGIGTGAGPLIVSTLAANVKEGP